MKNVNYGTTKVSDKMSKVSDKVGDKVNIKTANS